MATGLHPHQDLLVTTAVRFLTTVATSVHHHLFAAPEVLTNVCQKIISPNVQLLAQDEETFDENPLEYIRRDVEGSDTIEDVKEAGAAAKTEDPEVKEEADEADEGKTSDDASWGWQSTAMDQAT